MQQWLYPFFEGLSPAEYHFFNLALFLLLVFSAYKIYQTNQRFRFIRDTATSRVVSAAQGYVELKGLGEMLEGGNIVSPFSQRRCLWYQCKIEVKRSSGKRSFWVEESNDISEEVFLLRDETGDCVVIPDGAQVIPSQQRVWYGSGRQSMYQSNLNQSVLSRWIGFGNYRFTEKLIMVADSLYVIGEFESVRKSINEQSIQQQTDDLVKFWKTQPMRFLKPFDRDNNNKIEKKEWKQIREQAYLQVMSQHQQPLIHTISRGSEKKHPFIISALPEEELLKKKRIYLVLYLVLFFGLLFLFVNSIYYPS